MSDNWLLADSFEQGSCLIEALNIILIHNKLFIAGVKDNQRSEDVERARSCLAHFLQELDQLLPKIEADRDASLPGQAPRTGDFVRQFVQARRQDSENSRLFAAPLSNFANLLNAQDMDSRRDLVDGLTTLREMLEQHHHADISRVLGEL